MVTSIDGFLGEKMTRRTAIATVVGTVGLVATEFALSKTVPVVKAALVPQRPKSNILLITFDALGAEDMSVYGYGLPTTPNIDAFARNGYSLQELLFRLYLHDSMHRNDADGTLSLGTPCLSADGPGAGRGCQ